MSSSPSVLDVFCGMGGWSVGFHREGFECKGVDIVDVGYPYDLVTSNVLDYRPDFHPDVVIESPPCTEFSGLTTLSYIKGQRGPPVPEKGLELVRAGLRIIERTEPKFWVLENVMGSIPYISPLLGEPMLVYKPWVLWGNLSRSSFNEALRRPNGDHKLSHTFERNKGGNRIGLPEDFPFDPLRSWKRARIPVFLSQIVARWCKRELINGRTSPSADG